MAQVALVQARVSSRRLPGKVLREVAGKPLLIYLLERLQHSRLLSGIIVATSDDVSDDPVAELCNTVGVHCRRGPLKDVAARLLKIAEVCDCGAFVRINGDSPLLDPLIVDRAIELFEASDCDLATNVLVRSFPKGQSVEVIRTTALRRAYDNMKDSAHREHVTSYFYDNSDNFSIRSFESGRPLGKINLSIDSLQDFTNFSSMIAAMDRPHWEYTLDDLLSMRRVLADGEASS